MKNEPIRPFIFKERNMPAKFLNETNKQIGLIILYTCIIFFFLYIPFNTKGTYHFKEIPGFPKYDDLSSAFMVQQLHLQQKVDPETLQADDPRDPTNPSRYMFDRIIWNGKYYFQFEPLPAFFHLGWTAITGLPFRTGVMVIISISGVLVILGLLMIHLRQLYFQSTPAWIFWGVWISFSLCSVQLHMASMPFVYNEAVGLGSLFSLLGIFFAFIAFPDKNGQKIRTALSGIFFGAAVCCRASLVLYPVTLLGCLIVVWLLKDKAYKDIVNLFLPFLVCFGLFVLALLAYNFMRFGNPLEFGRSHTIFPSYEDYLYAILNQNMFRLQHVPLQLYLYLFSPPDIIDKFPYLVIPNETRFRIGDVLVVSQRVRSIFILAPILVALFPAPFLMKYCRIKTFTFWITYFFISSASIFGLLTFFHYTTIRYIYDFMPLLFVNVFCMFSMLWQKYHSSDKSQKTVKLVFVSLVCITILNGLLVGFLKMRS